MTREEAIQALNEIFDDSEFSRYEAWYGGAMDMAIEALSADAEDRLYIKIYADDEPSVKAEKLYQICGETQHKEVTEWLKEYFPDMAIEALSADTERRADCSNFLLWLLDEIMDEENWELNAVADGEIIARKLKKLGLLEVKDGYYHCIFDENVWVVRCKDCKHYSVEGDVTRFGYCNGVHEHDTDPNGFCHHGERREHGQD